MRLFFLLILLTINIYLFNHLETQAVNEDNMSNNSISIIIEVNGDPHKYRRYIEKNFPTLEVVTTYSILFQGIALKGSIEKIDEVVKSKFVQAVYPVQTYETLKLNELMTTEKFITNFNTKNVSKNYYSFEKRKKFDRNNIVLPEEINNTQYTGKGINVAVIDTGIDYTHPDLHTNFIKGKDVVDLDDDPMETKIEEGLPTNHGTHVAGIIGANGNIKGVAPNVNLYAYRALGPGGVGTTIQILAALEEAIKDDVDIINLSLGNSVNGPDYPTSLAVNEAAKRGVAVVIANGNSGPNNWTIGAPATASSALSVGAYDKERYVPYLYDAKEDKKINITTLPFSLSWQLKRDYEIVTNLKGSSLGGKIALIPLTEDSYDKIIEAEQLGAKAVLIYETELMTVNELVGMVDEIIEIPVALIEEKDGKWIENRKERNVYFKSKLELKKESIAPFSSRGPVTVNWMLKPDVIAPGVNVMSTVPNGYNILNGTSMAAPHVAGAIAVLKEANPHWTNEQIFGALKTTAKEIKENKERVSPFIQGTGLIQIDEALKTDTIIYNPLLSFGKVSQHITERTIDLTIENNSPEKQRYSFEIPKKESGISWELQRTFTINAHEKQTIPITLKTNSILLTKGIYDGRLTLVKDDGKKFSLPYMFINEEDDYPHVMGFTFHLDMYDESNYKYQLYAAEQVQSVQVYLYEPFTLMYKGKLIHLEDIDVGMHEGEIKRNKVNEKGYFYGLIVVQLKNGEYVNYETNLYIT